MFGYILAVVIFYKVLIKDEESSCCENVTSSSDDNSDTSSNNSTSDGSDKSLDTKKGTSFKVKEGIGVLKLPSCNLVAVQLAWSVRGQEKGGPNAIPREQDVTARNV